MNDFFTAAIVGEAFVLELKPRHSAQQALLKHRVGAFSFPQGQLLTVGNPIASNLDLGVTHGQLNSGSVDNSGAAAVNLDFDWEHSGKKHPRISHALEPENTSASGVGWLLVLILLLILTLGGVYLLWI